MKYMHIALWATTEIGSELSDLPDELYDKVASFFAGDMAAGLWLKKRGVTGFDNIRVRVHITDDPKRTTPKKRKKAKKK
jgi:hypothetical protein